MKKWLETMKITTSDNWIKLFLVIKATTSNAALAAITHKQITGALSIYKAWVLCDSVSSSKNTGLFTVLKCDTLIIEIYGNI